MKNKITVSLICFIAASVLIISCKAKSSSPAAPVNTPAPVLTSTITMTASVTPTITLTTTASATFTPTVTVTATSTPEDYVFDDFEDNNMANPINNWIATANTPGSFVHSSGIVSTAPLSGSYALRISGTAVSSFPAGGGNFWGIVLLNTGSTSAATPANLSAYNNIKFKMAFPGYKKGSATTQIYLSITNDINTLEKVILTDLAPGFTEYTIPISSFSDPSSARASIMSAVKQISVSVYSISTTGGDFVSYEMTLDDIKFTN